MTSLLSADDLNDFIAPGVACIKEETSENDGDTKHIQLEFEFDPSGEVTEKSSNKKLSKAQISLTDCLACSGCITSMEEVLVAQHSHGEFIKALNNESNHDRIWVLSLSQQARASLASAFNVPIAHMDSALAKIFVDHFNFNYVVSVNVGREITNIEVCKEAQESNKANKGPSLLSVCPGWVLYVEKTHPELVDSMSQIKSPQGVTGGMLNTLLGPKVYHLSIMPCFDKKLEAARDKDVVDCVITPREVIVMFEERGIDLNEVLRGINPAIRTNWTPENWFRGNDYGWGGNFGSTSGGYAYNYILERQRLLESPSEIKTLKGRNNDIYELQLVSPSGEVLSRTGVVNGFKNIQNLVRKLKPDTSAKPVSSLLARRRRGKAAISEAESTIDLTKCELLEIMACPQGCINGGGQIKAPEGTLNNSWVESVTGKYNDEPVVQESEDDVYNWLETVCKAHSVNRDALLKMEVKAVEKIKDDPMEMFTSTW